MRESTVWLVQTDGGYVHCAFTTFKAASLFCNLHPDYHVIECPVYVKAFAVR